MQAYSLDLRQRIVRACEEEGCTREEIAALFAVSRSFVQKLLRRYEGGAALAPPAWRRGRKATLGEKECRRVRQLVQDNPDATLQELCDLLRHEKGPSVSPPTMCRALQALRWPLKKKVAARRRAGHAAGEKAAAEVVAPGSAHRRALPRFRR
jgi:transposase